VTGIVTTFGFFLIQYERLLKDREEESGRTVVANRELTELKDHLEDTVRERTAELSQARRMEGIGRLAGGVAHDFNILLTVMVGCSGLLHAKLPSPSPLTRYVDQIAGACQQAQTLTQQLLAFGRRQQLRPVVLDINDVVREVEVMLKHFIGGEIELVTALDPAAGRVTADRAQLHQVIMNLVLNARDAMPSGGRLVIETASTFISEDRGRRQDDIPAGSYVMLTVKDSGVGMDPETQSRIFEPFFTTKDTSKGAGLGLSTVYGIVKQSAGHIQVESKRAQGTSIRLLLPRAG
jgi:signal transduction histidine kinase